MDAQNPCIASFTNTDDGNGTYTFTSTSAPTYNVWWEIDSIYIPGAVVTQTFANGIHQVCMHVEDSAISCYDVSCQTINVLNGIGCNSAASFSYLIGNNAEVTFNSTSTGSFMFEDWGFGDGTYNNGTSPHHVYTYNGTYNVCVTISDSNQTCSNTFCDNIVVTNAINSTPCNIIAGFTSIDNGNGNFSFLNTSIGGTIFDWNFGDGNTSSSENPNHTFVANGTFVVVLAVTDLDSNLLPTIGCIDYFTSTITVLGVNNPSVSCNAAFVMYTDSSYNGVVVVNSSTGNNLTYSWNFGDGNTSNLPFPNYTYMSAGPFYLCLAVSDGNGCASTYCDSIGTGGIIFKQVGFDINVSSPTTVGIKNEVSLISTLEFYPNPVKNELNIELGLTEQATVEVFITDVLGKTVAQITNKESNAGTSNYKLNTMNIKNGIYLLNIVTNNSRQVKKLIVTR